VLTVFVSLLAVLVAVALAIRMRRMGARLFLGFEDTVLFVAGGAMIVGCFFVDFNIHYRAILLLLTVPLLLAWLRQEVPLLRMAGWIGVGLVAFALFQNFLRVNLFDIVNAASGTIYRTTMVFGALEEAVWWCLIIALMSAMLLIAWDSRA